MLEKYISLENLREFKRGLDSRKPTFKTINNESIIGTGNIEINADIPVFDLTAQEMASLFQGEQVNPGTRWKLIGSDLLRMRCEEANYDVVLNRIDVEEQKTRYVVSSEDDLGNPKLAVFCFTNVLDYGYVLTLNVYSLLTEGEVPTPEIPTFELSQVEMGALFQGNTLDITSNDARYELIGKDQLKMTCDALGYNVLLNRTNVGDGKAKYVVTTKDGTGAIGLAEFCFTEVIDEQDPYYQLALDVSQLPSINSFKTINDENIVGSGNIEVNTDDCQKALGITDDFGFNHKLVFDKPIRNEQDIRDALAGFNLNDNQLTLEHIFYKLFAEQDPAEECILVDNYGNQWEFTAVEGAERVADFKVFVIQDNGQPITLHSTASIETDPETGDIIWVIGAFNNKEYITEDQLTAVYTLSAEQYQTLLNGGTLYLQNIDYTLLKPTVNWICESANFNIVTNRQLGANGLIYQNGLMVDAQGKMNSVCFRGDAGEESRHLTMTITRIPTMDDVNNAIAGAITDEINGNY